MRTRERALHRVPGPHHIGEDGPFGGVCWDIFVYQGCVVCPAREDLSDRAFVIGEYRLVVSNVDAHRNCQEIRSERQIETAKKTEELHPGECSNVLVLPDSALGASNPVSRFKVVHVCKLLSRLRSPAIHSEKKLL